MKYGNDSFSYLLQEMYTNSSMILIQIHEKFWLEKADEWLLISSWIMNSTAVYFSEKVTTRKI